MLVEERGAQRAGAAPFKLGWDGPQSDMEESRCGRARQKRERHVAASGGLVGEEWDIEEGSWEMWQVAPRG